MCALPSQSELLWREHEEFGDVHMITSRDTYIDLPTKTLQALALGSALGLGSGVGSGLGLGLGLGTGLGLGLGLGSGLGSGVGLG